MTALLPDSGSQPRVVGGSDVSSVILPGSDQRLRAASGVTGPQDVPLWMARGGGSARSAAAGAMACAGAVRRVRDTLSAVLVDAASALGWRGKAATQAQARAHAVHGTLDAVALRLDSAHTALLGLAAALDAQRSVLGAAAPAWAQAAGPDQRLALTRRWQPATAALDAADARTAEALHGVSQELARLREVGRAEGWGGEPGRTGPRAASGSAEPGTVHRIGDSVGGALAGTVNGLASMANALGRHPDAALEMVTGLLLADVGIAGEAAGLGLDVTGVGAAAGVPVNVAAAGALTAGAGLLAAGSSKIMMNAAGDDRVTPLDMPPRRTSHVDIENANYAQKTAGSRFSQAGKFKKRLVSDVANDLRTGKLSPDDVPIDVICRKGKWLILNTRSAQALNQADIPRSGWRVVDRTGQSDFEGRLSDQLTKNGLGEGGVGSVVSRKVGRGHA